MSKRYTVRLKETGEELDTAEELLDAWRIIKKYEAEDRRNAQYEEDYYEIIDEDGKIWDYSDCSEYNGTVTFDCYDSKQRTTLDVRAKISIDNGATWTTPAEAIDAIGLDTIAAYLDHELCEKINFRLAPCSDEEFLTAYLDECGDDVIIG